MPVAVRPRCSSLRLRSSPGSGCWPATRVATRTPRAVWTSTLEALRGGDLEAQGTIGASDPLQSADDGLRRFPADEVVFVTHPETGSSWLEKGVVARAEERYEQPVKHIVVEAG